MFQFLFEIHKPLHILQTTWECKNARMQEHTYKMQIQVHQACQEQNTTGTSRIQKKMVNGSIDLFVDVVKTMSNSSHSSG